MINKIPIRLYYKSDGTIFNQGGLNKIPLLTKLSNYAYELTLVTPLHYDNYTVFAVFEKADGSKTNGYPMEADRVSYETVKVGSNYERWYIYKTTIQDDVLNISSSNYSNQLKIGFKVQYNTGLIDEVSQESVIGTFNYVPTTTYCAYTLETRSDNVEDTNVKILVDYINSVADGKLEKAQSILLMQDEPTLDKTDGSPFYNLGFVYYFTKDTTNHKKGEIAQHILDSNGNSVLQTIGVYNSTYSTYDDSQIGSDTPRKISERFGDVSNYLNLLNSTKVSIQEGKGLSTNDFTDEYKNKLDSIDGDINNQLQEGITEAKNYTDTKIADLVNSAPETLDTLGEVAKALEDNEEVVQALNSAIGTKANASDVYTKEQTDASLRNKVDKVSDKSLVLNSEISKLLTVEHNANYYVLPSDVPHDRNYVHTDNNFTNELKQKLEQLKNFDDRELRILINNVQSIANQYTNEKINELISGASSDYDTLKELQDLFLENADLINVLNQAISNKVSKEDGKGLSTNDFTNEDKDILKYSPKPLYNKDYNYNSYEIIMGAINYTHENRLKSKIFIYDGNIDNLILVINRWSNYYEAIELFYLHNEKVVYNIVQAPVADTSLIVEASRGQIVETGGSGSGGSVDLEEVKSYIDEELGKIVDNAPEALNTLNELATAYTEQGEVVEALNSAINNKVDKVEGKQLSTNDYTDYDKQKVSNLPVSIKSGYSPQITMKNAVTYVIENNLGGYFNVIVDGNTRERIIVNQYGPNFWQAYSCHYYQDDNNLLIIGNDIRIDTNPENIELSYEKIIPTATKTSELENDAGFVTKNIIPNELNSKFAISNSDTDLTSNMTSVSINSSSTGRIRGIAYGNGVFVVVDQTGKIQHSKDNGNTYSLSNTPTSNPVTSVAYGKGLFVCVDYITSGGNIYKSTDGINWDYVYTFESGIESITYANGRFTLVGESGLVAFTDDLEHFNLPNTNTTNNLIGITYGQNKYVAVSSAGQIIYSLDGVIWNDCSIEGDTTHYRVATYGKGVFVIGGRETINGVATSVIRYSYDGIHWNTASNNSTKTTSYVRSLAYYNGKFFAALQQGEIWTSIDGVNWEVILSTSAMWAIACGNEIVLIGGESGLINKYSLNIEWLDYEPKLNANQVLWQKQYLTLSDGSIVESEVEVHTNMKQITNEILGSELEYEPSIDLDLANKTIIFNKNLNLPQNLNFGDGIYYIFKAQAKRIINNEEIKNNIFRIQYSIKSNNINEILLYNETKKDYLNIYKNGIWYNTEISFNNFGFQNIYIYYLHERIDIFSILFKIIEKEKTLSNTILNLDDKLKNVIPNLETIHFIDDVRLITKAKKALQYYIENNITYGSFSCTFDKNALEILYMSVAKDGNDYVCHPTFFDLVYLTRTKFSQPITLKTNDEDVEHITTSLVSGFSVINLNEESMDNSSIEGILTYIWENFGDHEFYKVQLKKYKDDPDYEDFYETLLINYSYDWKTSEEFANVITPQGNKVYKATYDEDGNLNWEEITESTPTKEELVQSVIEALPKYNGEVIE